MRFLLPVALFALSLALLEWLAHRRVPALPLHTVAVAALTVWITRRVRWAKLAARVPPRSRRFRAVLFLLFTAHFARVLDRESRRMLTARSLTIRRRLGPGAFTSLKWAVAGVFTRALLRAERFYAAQRMKGLGE